MGSSEENVLTSDGKNENENTGVDAGDNSDNEVADSTEPSLINISVGSSTSATEGNTSKEGETPGAGNSKKTKKKFRHGKKSDIPSKDNLERSAVRRLHHPGTKFKQSKKRAQSFPSISKYFLPTKKPRKETFIPPTKFLLGGNISDPLNLNSLQDENVNRAMNAVTPESSPLPTPPRHKAKIDVIIPPNIRDPLNLIEPLDNDEYEKRLEIQQRKPRKKPRIRRRTIVTNANININIPTVEVKPVKDEGIKEPLPPEPSTSKSRKRSCSDSDNSSLKGKDGKKLGRMDLLDKIVSPVVPQPGAWMRARPQQRTGVPERPVSPHRTKLKSTSEEDQQMPTFHPKNSIYQYGNYDRIRCCELFFETLNCPALCIQPQPVLSMYGSGSTTGICVDIGYDTTDVVPVFEGGMVKYAHMQTGISGVQISEYIKKSLGERNLLNEILTIESIEDIKKQCLYITLKGAMSIQKQLYKLPSGAEIDVSNEAFISAEQIFQPGLLEDNKKCISLQEAIVTASLKCDADLRSELCAAIVPCGGMSTIPGVNERLWTELQGAMGSSVTIITSPESYAVAWLGGATFAGLQDVDKLWIQKKQFEDYGAKIVKNKFM